jgi:hypothetical protein
MVEHLQHGDHEHQLGEELYKPGERRTQDKELQGQRHIAAEVRMFSEYRHAQARGKDLDEYQDSDYGVQQELQTPFFAESKSTDGPVGCQVRVFSNMV